MAKVMQLRHGYYACVSYIDALIGRLLDELERLDLDDNTVIALWGDHGFHLGEQGIWAKANNYELSTRAPMILSIPNQPNRGAKTEALIEFVDLYPTLVEYCGLPDPDHALDGHSFTAQIRNPDAPWNRPSFTSYGVNYASVRDTDYRYIQYPDGTEEIYEYSNDPWEFNNLTGDPELEAVKSRLRKWIPREWAPSTGGRLEVPQDMEKVMRPSTPWDHLKPNS